MAEPATGSIYRQASRLTRSRARTFYLASLFLPRHVRRDVHVVYAYYRTVDDLVDEPPAGWSKADCGAALQHWDDVLQGRTRSVDPLVCELLRVVARHEIPLEHLALVLEGARTDLNLTAVATMDELIEYSYRVAGSVGLVMAQILQAKAPEALHAAAELGIAMQLTNILRDVGEDLDRGRVYLPQNLLQMHGCDVRALRRGPASDQFRAVMRAVMSEARVRYSNGAVGIPYLSSQARFAISLAATMYARILDKIERNDFDVFTQRAHLSTLEKWYLAMPMYLQHRQVLRR